MTTPSPAPTTHADPTPDARAGEAARSVVQTFGRPLLDLPGTGLGVPGTHIGRRCFPAPGPRDLVWNYWWQAHYLDAMVDAGERHLRAGDAAGARGWAGLGRRLLRAVWLRNLGRFTNDFYDDMAWMILATQRLAGLEARLALAATPGVRTLESRVAPRLAAAESTDLGGGLFWTTKHDRKNVPATAPAAIYAARAGDTDRARRLVDWIYATLVDEASGLVLDTIYPDGRVDRAVYAYNQGIVLGALLAIGDDVSLRRAESLLDAIDRGLRAGDGARPVLRAGGDGDGGLFTGILVRYLALAAADERLSPPARDRAAALVSGTAEAMWRGSRVWHLPPGGRLSRVFSNDTTTSAADGLAPGATLEFSPQLQAWTILEAAATPACASAAPARSSQTDPRRA